MKFKELLVTYNSMKGKHKSLVLQLKELRELCGLPRTGESLGLSTQRSSSASIENYVIKLDELEREIERTDKQILQVRQYLEIFISHISNRQAREVVENFTFRNSDKPNWYKIARRVNYSETHTKRLYKIGIAEIEDLEMEVHL